MPTIFERYIEDLLAGGPRYDTALGSTFGQAAVANQQAKQALDALNLQKLIQYDLPLLLHERETQRQRELAELKARQQTNMLLGLATQMPALIQALGALGLNVGSTGGGLSGFDIRDAGGNLVASGRLPGTSSFAGGLGPVYGGVWGAPQWMRTPMGLLKVRHPGARYDQRLGWQFNPYGVNRRIRRF